MIRFFLSAFTLLFSGEVVSQSLSGNISLQNIYFPDDTLYSDIEQDGLSLGSFLNSEYEFNDSLSSTFSVQLHLGEVGFIDLEQAHLDFNSDNISFSIGNDVVFWGKTEVSQINNIINQIDLRNDISGDDKLGQPMLRISYINDQGKIDFFYFPIFKHRKFSDQNHRLSIVPNLSSDATFYDFASDNTPSFAMRYEQAIDEIDFGVHFFKGIDRTPAFISSGSKIAPIYSEFSQVGADIQYTNGDIILKSEYNYSHDQLNRNITTSNNWAAAIGIEYTLYGVQQSNSDLTLIGEYSYDSRNDLSLSPFQNDFALGARLNLNNIAGTQIEAFLLKDVDLGTLTSQISYSHRINENLSIAIEGNIMNNISKDDILYNLRYDSNIGFSLIYSF